MYMRVQYFDKSETRVLFLWSLYVTYENNYPQNDNTLQVSVILSFFYIYIYNFHFKPACCCNMNVLYRTRSSILLRFYFGNIRTFWYSNCHSLVSNERHHRFFLVHFCVIVYRVFFSPVYVVNLEGRWNKYSCTHTHTHYTTLVF